MIANYGYEDGTGFYYITIDGHICATCTGHGCVPACPQGVYAIEMDDYDDYAAVVVESARRRLRELCSECKGRGAAKGPSSEPPCTSACPGGALKHSW